MRLEEKIGSRLKATKKTLSVAESCSGGLLAHRLTNVSGSSAYFSGGVVTYSNQSKIHILKVPDEIIDNLGAVSPQVACSMAENVRKLFKADYGIGITGIAGPTGGTKEKPIGLVYMAIASPHHGIKDYKCHFSGNRQEIKDQAVDAVLHYLWDLLEKG